MKLTIFIIIILSISGCRFPWETDEKSTETQTVIIISPPEYLDTTSDATSDEDAYNIKFAVQSGSDVYFSDGVTMYPWKSGNIKRAGPMLYSVEDKLLTLDPAGITVDSVDLLKVPINIKSTSYGNFYCFQYPAAESYAMGGMYKIYSEYYLDGAVLSEWYNNQFECRGILAVGQNVFALDQVGAYHVIYGTAEIPSHVNDNEFYIHSLDMPNKTIGFNDSIENYSLNHVLNATAWNKFGGEYYSGNGYKWSGIGGLVDAATELDKFTVTPYPISPAPPWGEAPVLLAAGESNGKLYWVECNSGWLFEYRIDTDYLEQKNKLYNGDGMRNTGIYKKQSLHPLIVEGVLYFSESNTIYKLELSTGILNIFYAGPGEVVRYE